MLSFVDLETVFNAKSTGMGIVCPHTQLHMPNASGSLVVGMKQSQI
jgi:hypothetical protein